MNKLLRLRIIEKFNNQISFAEALSISASAVSLIINNHRRLSPEAQDMWAKVLDTTPEALGLREYSRDNKS